MPCQLRPPPGQVISALARARCPCNQPQRPVTCGKADQSVCSPRPAPPLPPRSDPSTMRSALRGAQLGAALRRLVRWLRASMQGGRDPGPRRPPSPLNPGSRCPDGRAASGAGAASQCACAGYSRPAALSGLGPAKSPAWRSGSRRGDRLRPVVTASGGQGKWVLCAVLPQRPAVPRHSGRRARLWRRKARVRQRGGKGFLGPRQKDLAGCKVIGLGQ